VTVVDLHAHVIVPGLGAEVAWDERGQAVTLDGRTIRSAVREFSDLSRILEEQDAAGVDRIVLSPWVNLLDREPQRQNEALAALAGPRVAVLGTASLERPEELRALMADGRLAGVEVRARQDGLYLGDGRFREFWATAEETGALVFVHPTSKGLGDPVFERHYMWNTVGNPLETTIAAAHLVLSGVLDAHPRLKVVLAHGGGAILALRGRLAHEQGLREESRDVLADLRRFVYDTVVHDVDVLRALVAFAGPEQVVLGSDYPFDMGVERPAEIVRALGLEPGDEAAILSGNAERLLARQGVAA
jgi:aminocarboxymuconate-semialdehyde decarboxylase